MNKIGPITLALACMLACSAAQAAPHVRYHVTLVQPEGATQPLVGGINASAHVAAAAILPGFDDEHALLVRRHRHDRSRHARRRLELCV